MNPPACVATKVSRLSQPVSKSAAPCRDSRDTIRSRASALRGDSQTAFLRRGVAALRLREFIMVSLKITTCALFGVALAAVSCVPPRATVVAPAPVVKTKERKAVEPSTAAVPELPTMPDEGIRMPDMLGLPTDGDFQATSPVLPRTGPGTGSVISRPPTDPPSRVKPKPTE